MGNRPSRRIGFTTWICLALLPVLATAQTTQPGSVPIVQLRGSGVDLGEQQGRQLKSSINALHTRYLHQFIRNDSQRFAAMAAAALFQAQLPQEYRDEIHALATASGEDERQVMLAQCFLDLMPMTACSTITLPASAAPDGVARFGRNLDFPSFDIADKNTVLLVFHPKGKYAFSAVSWPGMVGVLSGMNEHGLSLANMEVSRGPRWPGAMPYTLLYRSILEQCKTVNEAIALLQKMPRQTANNLMLMDADGDRAVAEITPEGVHVRRAPADQALVCTNHQRGDDLDTPGRCRRYDVLHDRSKAEEGKLTPDNLERLLSLSAQGDMTLQSMIFEPSSRVLYLAAGKHATGRPYTRVDLTELMK